MLCPHCKDTHLAMTDRQGIEIDYCPNCRGIWLDRGELDRLIERAERDAAPQSPQSPPSPPPYRDPAHQQPRARDHGYQGDRYPHGRKKHKSLLGELFDF